MFTFLNSFALAALATIAIPLLIHLFTRQKTKIIYFSSLKFLKELQRQKIRRLKIRQFLLLALRMLLLLFLVLAFARPTFRTSNASAVSSGSPVTAVVILDNSLSMAREYRGQRLLEQAKKRAAEVVSLLKPGDEMYLLYPQNPPKFAHEDARFNIESMLKLIEATELSYHRTDYSAALTEARRIMLSSSNLNKEVYLIGDLQKNGFSAEPDSKQDPVLSEEVSLFVLPVQAKEEANLGITTLQIANQILEKGKVVEVKAGVRNRSDSPVSGKLAHLFVNGKRVGQQVVDAAPQSAKALSFKVVPEKTGFQSGYLLLENDDLNEDNKRFFAFHIAEEIPIVIVGNDPNDTFYLQLALRPRPDLASYIKIDEIRPSQFDKLQLESYRAVILSNVPRLNSTDVLKLQIFLKNGGGLMVLLGPDVDLRNYNENLQRKLKLPLLTQTIRQSGTEQFLSLTKFDFNHPIFRNVFDGDRSMQSPHIRFAVGVQSTRHLDKIIDYSNGAPFLFESHYENGKILYVTTGIASDWSDIAFRGLFVPLINRSVFYLAGAASAENEQALVGDRLLFQSGKVSTATGLALEKPDGSRSKVRTDVASSTYSVHIDDTEQPGIYRLFDGENVIGQWAVNYDAQETETTPISVDELQTTLAMDHIITVDPGSPLEQALQETRFGTELWKWLVGIALLLLLVESILAREKSFAQAQEA